MTNCHKAIWRRDLQGTVMAPENILIKQTLGGRIKIWRVHTVSCCALNGVLF